MSDLNPHVAELDPWVSAGIRQIVPMQELGRVFPDVYGQVAGAVAQAGGQLRGPAYACYFGMPTDVVDVEIGFGIDQELTLDGITVTSRPASRAVVATHVGPYEQLSASYGELNKWLESQDLKLAEHMWEFYDSPPGVDPAKMVTRMVFPLAE